MSVILYESGANAAGKKLQRIIKTFVPKEQIEICQSIEKLSERLRQPFYRKLIGVFIAADPNPPGIDEPVYQCRLCHAGKRRHPGREHD